MNLSCEFLKLPLQYDSERLAFEVGQFDEAEWRPHPQGHAGNTALPLVSLNGDPFDDNVKGPMRPTPFLERCPYIRQIFESLRAPLGRARLMRIAGAADATPHVDVNYYWLSHVRVHIPAVTFPNVRFLCGDSSVHMAPGEAWIFDTWRIHNAINPGPQPRIHLVADTVGSPAFDLLLERSARLGGANPLPPAHTAQHIAFNSARRADFAFEDVNFPVVMAPDERERLSAFVLQDAGQRPTNLKAAIAALNDVMARSHSRWRELWQQHADADSGWNLYRRHLDELSRELHRFKGQILLPNGVEAAEALEYAVIFPALNPELSAVYRALPKQRASVEPATPRIAAVPATPAAPLGAVRDVLERPVIVVASPRSGSTLLFETLARSPDLWTIGGESHEVVESIRQLHPEARGYSSNRLTAEDATPAVADRLTAAFRAHLSDREGNEAPERGARIRFLEKTPKNALRIPFFNAIFPDACFIYLYRDPRENMASIIEAWQSGGFVTYPDLPGWDGPPWSLFLIPNWKELRGKSIPEIAAAQWGAANRQIMDDLSQLPPERWCALRYTDLLAEPRAQIERICSFIGVRPPETLPEDLPLSRHTLTPPAPNKWRRFSALIEPLLPALAPLKNRAHELVARFSASSDERQLAARRQAIEPEAPPQSAPPAAERFAAAPPPLTPAPADAGDPAGHPLRSVHTSSVLELLRGLNASILVTTYQAGKLIVIREVDGVLNTHFRDFEAPMGLACDGRRLAVGTRQQIWVFYNQPDVAPKLDPHIAHDACFMPRRSHYTGDIHSRDLAWAGTELWVVNTRFSCLCTLDAENSFVPRWRPSFVSGLGPEDRCHLNGLAVVDGVPRYVTALGQSDAMEGWRERRANGGCVIDVQSGQILLTGLSMPHSPRWHLDRLWYLESGAGRLCCLDPQNGAPLVVAELPGFTRGLDFAGSYALVGLSQVRESSMFSGLPITERLAQEERLCGIWIVDIRTGKTAGFVRFESGIQEIFALQVLSGMRVPDVITDNPEILGNSFVIPDEALKEVSPPVPSKPSGA